LTILVEEHNCTVVGFAHVVFADDPRWGALLDNLHVAHAHQRQGLGSRLLVLVAEAVCTRGRSTGLHLWEHEQNVNAQAFYRARRGKCVETTDIPAPGGIPSRLNGKPTMLRYAWPDPSALCA
jgi:ribosomal protein S18 acetylase RimI-like enzyme